MADNTFTNSVSTSWDDADNWSAGIPALADTNNVIINGNCYLVQHSTTDTGKTFTINVGNTLYLGNYNLNCGTTAVTANGAISIGSGTWTVGDFTVSSTLTGSADNGIIQYTGNMDLSGCTGWTRYASGNYGPAVQFNGTIDKSLTVFGGAGYAGDSSNPLGTIDYGAACSAKLTVTGGSSGDELYLSNVYLQNGLAGAEIELTGGRTYISNSGSAFYVYTGGRGLTVKEGDGTAFTFLKTTATGSPIILGNISSGKGILSVGTTGDIDTLIASTTAVYLQAPNATSPLCNFGYHVQGSQVLQGIVCDKAYMRFSGSGGQSFSTETISNIKFTNQVQTFAVELRDGLSFKAEYLNFAGKNFDIDGASNIYLDNCQFSTTSGAGLGYIVSKNHNEVADQTYIFSHTGLTVSSDVLDISGQMVSSTENLLLVSNQTYTFDSTTASDVIGNTYNSLYTVAGATLDNNTGSDMVINGNFQAGTLLAGANKITVPGNFTINTLLTHENGEIELSTTSPNTQTVSGSEMTFYDLTMSSGTYVFSESGNPLAVANTFDDGSGTTVFTGTSTTAALTYYNLQINSAGSVNLANSTTAANFTITAGTAALGANELYCTGNFVNAGTFTIGDGTLTCVDITHTGNITGSDNAGTILFKGNADLSAGTWTRNGSSPYGPTLTWGGTAAAKTLTVFGGAGKTGGDAANHMGTINVSGSCSKKLTIGGGSGGESLYATIQSTDGLAGAELELTGGRVYTNTINDYTVNMSSGGTDITILKGDGATNTYIKNEKNGSEGIMVIVGNTGVFKMDGVSTSAFTGFVVQGSASYSKPLEVQTAVSGSIIKGVHLYNSLLELGETDSQDFATNVTIEDVSVAGSNLGSMWLYVPGNTNDIVLDNVTVDGSALKFNVADTANKVYISDSTFSTTSNAIAGTCILTSRNHAGVTGDVHVWSGSDVVYSSDVFDISGMEAQSGDDLNFWSAKTFTFNSTTGTGCSNTLGSILTASGTGITNTIGSSLTVNGTFNVGTYTAGTSTTVVSGDFTVGTLTAETSEIELSTTAGNTITVSGSEMTFYDLTHSAGTILYSENGNPLTVSHTFDPSTGTTEFSGVSTTGALTYYNLETSGTNNIATGGATGYFNSGTATLGANTLTCTGNWTNNGAMSIGTGTLSCVDIGGTGSVTGIGDGNIIFTGNVDLSSFSGWTRYASGDRGPYLTWNGTAANKTFTMFGTAGNTSNRLGIIRVAATASKKLTFGGGSSGSTTYYYAMVMDTGVSGSEFELTGGRTYITDSATIGHRTYSAGYKLTINPGDGTTNTCIQSLATNNPAVLMVHSGSKGQLQIGTTGDVDTLIGNNQAVLFQAPNASTGNAYVYLGNHLAGGVNLYGVQFDNIFVQLFDAAWTADDLSYWKFINQSKTYVIDYNATGVSDIYYMDATGKNIRVSCSCGLYLNNCIFSNISYNSGTGWVVSEDHNTVADDRYIWTGTSLNLDNTHLTVSGSRLQTNENIYLRSAQTYVFTSTTNSDISSTLVSIDSVASSIIDNNIGADHFIITGGFNVLGTYRAGTGTTEVYSDFVCDTLTAESSVIHLSTTSGNTLTVSGSEMTFNDLYLDGSGLYEFSENGNPLTVSGTFTPNTSTTLFSGTATTGALTYYNLETSGAANLATSQATNYLISAGTGALGTNTLTVTDTFTDNGTFTVSTGTLNAKDITGTGAFTVSGAATLNFTGDVDWSNLTYTKATETWNWNGASGDKTWTNSATAYNFWKLQHGSLCANKLTITGNAMTLSELTSIQGASGAEFYLDGGYTYSLSSTVPINYASGYKLSIEEGDTSSNTIISMTGSTPYAIFNGANVALDIGTTGDVDALIAANTGVRFQATAGHIKLQQHSAGDVSIQGTLFNDVYTDFSGQAYTADTLSEWKFQNITGDNALINSGNYNISLAQIDATGKTIKNDGTEGIYLAVSAYDDISITATGWVVDYNASSKIRNIYTGADIDIDSVTLDVTGAYPTSTTDKISIQSAYDYTITNQSRTDGFTGSALFTAVSGSYLIDDATSGAFTFHSGTNNLYSFDISTSATVVVGAATKVYVQTLFRNYGTLTITDTGYLFDIASKRIHAYEGTVEADTADVQIGTYSLLITPNSATNYVQVTYNVNGTNDGFTVDTNQQYNFVFKAKFNRSLTAATETAKMIISTGKTGTGTVLATKVISGTPNIWHTYEKAFNSGSATELFVTWYARRKTALQSIVHRIDNSYLEKVL